MEVIYERCCGIDVHRDSLVCTLRKTVGKHTAVESRTFETYADGIESLSCWLDENDVQVVAMEATGVYFKPVVFALRRLAPHRLIWVVNPAAVRQLKGRKTDVKDSAWIAQLLMSGLLRPSFIPEQALEELRLLARFRVKQVQAKNATKNRIIKLVEAQGIKLASVVSDVLGKSGRAMLEALAAGASSPAEIAELAQGTLRNKKQELTRALGNPCNTTARWILRRLLDDLRHQETRIHEIELELARLLDAGYQTEVALLKQIPGISDVAAAAVVAEIGGDMSVFPTPGHLASWGGLAPGAHQSAGHSRKAPARPGNPWLRTVLVQVAQMLARKKDSPWRAFFLRTLRNTANYNKSVLAVARKIAVTIFYVLRDGAYRPAQPRALSDNARRNAKIQAVTSLERLGYQVTLTPSPA